MLAISIVVCVSYACHRVFFFDDVWIVLRTLRFRESRLGGEEEDGEEKSPPSNRGDLVSECRVMERQIQAIDVKCETATWR